VASKGLNCSGYKDDFLRRRIETRMHLKGIPTYADYAHYLDRHESEIKELLDALTINVSEFFRDPTAWDALRTRILPPLVKDRILTGKRELRCWSAGIADGEEPYTLAICILEALSYHWKAFKIEILATDVDSGSLQRARNGIYAPARIRLVKQSLLQRFFTPIDGANMRLSEEVRKLVTFKQHDLFATPPSSQFDIVTCRNVIIYFSREQQQALFVNFYNALAPGGYLMLGKVETLIGEEGSMFKCVDLRERIYQKTLVNTTSGE
jgi:chemotaxis protein methyltransferase CheR